MLLGRIAELGWFTHMGEPAATQAIWMLLDEPVLKDATLAHLTDQTSVDLSGIGWFVPESIYPDRARPDLEGMEAHRGGVVPRLVVEMKFGAPLNTEQVLAYLRNQSARLAGEMGAFVLLVPSERRAEADRVLATSYEMWAGDVVRSPIRSAVITWREWLDVWQEAAASEIQGPRSIAADVSQLRAMCKTLSGTYVAPFDHSVESSWRDREEDLRDLVRGVSAAITPKRQGERLLPARSMGSFWGRWVYPVDDTRIYLAVGLVPRFADQGQAPLWLHFPKQAESFEQIRARLLNSPIGSEVRHDGGSLWLPLTIPESIAGLDLIEALTTQVREVIGIAAAHGGASE